MSFDIWSSAISAHVRKCMVIQNSLSIVRYIIQHNVKCRNILEILISSETCYSLSGEEDVVNWFLIQKTREAILL